MSMSIQAAKIGLAEIHKDLAGSDPIARVLSVVSFDDGVGIRIARIRPRQHLLHLEGLPRAQGNNRSCPFLNRFTRLTPEVFGRIPWASVLKPERDQPKRSSVESRGLDCPGQVGVACIVPLLIGLDNGNLARNPFPKSRSEERRVGKSVDLGGR